MLCTGTSLAMQCVLCFVELASTALVLKALAPKRGLWPMSTCGRHVLIGQTDTGKQISTNMYMHCANITSHNTFNITNSISIYYQYEHMPNNAC